MAEYIPDFLRELLAAQYGNELAARIEDGYTKRRPVTLRVNTLKSSAGRVKEQLDAAGIRWRNVAWSAEALILEEAREPAVRELPIYQNGEIYLQSLSSMVPPLLMEPRPGECILDMAAAPGGKTTQLAALSGGQAQITACEKNRARVERLRYNLEKQGARGVVVMNEDARKLDPFFAFDKILLDAPCSGSGTISVPPGGGAGAAWSADARPAGTEPPRAGTWSAGAGPAGTEPPRAGTWSVGAESAGAEPPRAGTWSAGAGSAGTELPDPAGAVPMRPRVGPVGAGHPAVTRELIDRSVRTQEALLKKALQILKPGREMIYSTCSVLEMENESVLRRVLPAARAKVVPICHSLLAELPLLPVTLKGTVCICPTELYEGFFVAKIQKGASR